MINIMKFSFFSKKRYTKEVKVINEVKYATDIIVKEVKRVRELSPLWEMAQEGVDISKIKWAHH